jgi:hypothetical protein
VTQQAPPKHRVAHRETPHPHTRSAVATIVRSLALSIGSGESVAEDGSGEPTLRGHCQTLERHVAYCLADARLEPVHGLLPSSLGDDEPKDARGKGGARSVFAALPDWVGAHEADRMYFRVGCDNIPVLRL